MRYPPSLHLLELAGILTILMLQSSHEANAFSVSVRDIRATRLFATGPVSDENDYFDVEAARKRLEALVGAGGDVVAQQPQSSSSRVATPSSSSSSSATPFIQISPTLDIKMTPPPLLTSIERRRRRLEMELLSQLAEGDDVVGDLWSLWFQERGPGAAEKLSRADEMINQGPRYWSEAESMICSLIDEYGMYWAEPVNRLATLYYLQGRLQESETLCKIVLHVKPWHFGALSGIVMVYAGMKDADAARQWAARRLPTMAPDGPTRRRLDWVAKARADAEQSMLQAEKNIRDSLGKVDRHVTDRNKDKSNKYEDDDAWQ